MEQVNSKYRNSRLGHSVLSKINEEKIIKCKKKKILTEMKKKLFLKKRSKIMKLMKIFLNPKKQDEWKFNMEPVFDFPVPLSAYLVGKWRITLLSEFIDQKPKKTSCIRYFGDIVEL